MLLSSGYGSQGGIISVCIPIQTSSIFSGGIGTLMALMVFALHLGESRWCLAAMAMTTTSVIHSTTFCSLGLAVTETKWSRQPHSLQVNRTEITGSPPLAAATVVVLIPPVDGF